MLDDLNELKTFRAILAEGSLSAAARRLGVTLAMVSKRLSTLEGRAGVRLIHRSTRALSPTEEGVRLLADLVHSSLCWSAAKPSKADREASVSLRR
jgi:DNA-binding transcriptional LysR family regulator